MATRTAINLNSPLLLYQRHRDKVEDLFVAAGLVVLVGLFLEAAGVFAGPWRTVLLLAIAGLGAYERVWGYNAAVVVLLWPLWTVSPYLTILFLFAALLPRDWIVERLHWGLLVASAPLLAQWQIVGVVPLVAGLVAGRMTALWVGAAATLWLKLVGGLAGWQPEIGALHGASLSLAAIGGRLAGASFFESLRLLVMPLAESPWLHLAQVGAWGAAGWLVAIARQAVTQKKGLQLPLVPALSAGVLVLWAALYLLPVRLEGQSFWALLALPTPAVGLALSAILAALVGGFYESVQPRVVRRRTPAKPRTKRRMSREGMREVSEPKRNTRTTARRHPWAEIPQPSDDDLASLKVD